MLTKKKFYDLPLGWSRAKRSSVQIENCYLKSSQTYWLYTAKIPDNLLFEECFRPAINSYSKILIRGCNEKIKNLLNTLHFQSIPIGSEAIIPLDQNIRIRKSIRKALRYSLKYGSFERVILNPENLQKLILLKAKTRHAHKPHLKHLFNKDFNSDIDCFVWKSNNGEWQAVITVSRIHSEKVQAELLLRKADAANGALEALIYNTTVYFSNKGYRYLSLGEVPFIFSEKHIFNLKAYLLSFFGRHLRFAYDAPNLYTFKNKFNPVWKTVYLCGYPKISLLALIEMAFQSNYIKLIFRQLCARLFIISVWKSLVKKIFTGRRIKQLKINEAPERTVRI